MAWLQWLDFSLLRLINLQWHHPVLDPVMSFLSGNVLFYPLVGLAGLGLLGWGGPRGRMFVFVTAVVLLVGDNFVVNALKSAVARPRPYIDHPEVRLLSGRGTRGSMPSSHAATCFAATMLAGLYYRRSWRWMLPVAGAVGYSRVYVGAHYPSDVAMGAILGMGYAAAGVCALHFLWQWVGQNWFPRWWVRRPWLLAPEKSLPDGPAVSQLDHAPSIDRHWMRLGFVVLGVVLVTRLAFLASGAIELSKDEAYQWLWSKHLALSYYSKPPLIAWMQWLSTAVWGDTEFGVRFLSPLLGTALAAMILRFMGQVTDGRTAFWLVAALTGVPLLVVGSTLLTVDCPLLFCWALAMVLGWRAVQPDGSLRHWLGVGLALGLGFLAKYAALFQLVGWALFLGMWRPARAHLRRPGPYLALAVVALCTLPVVIWNAQHGWITVEHVAHSNARVDQGWNLTLSYVGEFLGSQAGLWNPFFFVGAIWAASAFWKERPTDGAGPGRYPLMLYLFCMGAPVLIGFALFSLQRRVLANWPAPALVPMFCLAAVFWSGRWQAGARWIKPWLAAGVGLGLVTLVLLQLPNAVKKLVGRPLPPGKDPLRRTLAWRESARFMADAHARLAAQGTPTFVIADQYGTAAQLLFYWPEARRGPLVYPRESEHPENQFWFWPEFRYRKLRRGQNALAFVEVTMPRSPLGPWLHAALTGGPVTEAPPPSPQPPPAELNKQFAWVTSLGVFPVEYRGRIYRWFQLFECRDVQSPSPSSTPSGSAPLFRPTTGGHFGTPARFPHARPLDGQVQ